MSIATFNPVEFWRKLGRSSVFQRVLGLFKWAVAGSVVSRITSIASMVLIARLLGPEEFGKLAFLVATVGVAGILAGMGLGLTATRFVAQHIQTDKAATGRVISLVSHFNIVMVVISAGLIASLSGIISETVMKTTDLSTGLIVGVVLMASNSFRGVQAGVLAGFERFDVIAKLSIIEGAVTLISLFPLAYLYGIHGCLIGLSLGPFIAWLVGLRQLKSLCDNHSVRFMNFDGWQEWRLLFSFSLPTVIAHSLAGPVLWACMAAIANQPNGYQELGLYNAAYQWHGPLVFLPMVLMSSAIPILVKEWEDRHRKKFLRIAGAILCVALVATILPGGLIALFSRQVMSLYGADYAEGSTLLLYLLAAVPLHAISKIAGNVLLAMNRPWLVLIPNLFWGASLIIFTLSYIESSGVYALARGFLLAYGLQCALLGFLVFLSVVLDTKKLDRLKI